MKRIFLMLGAAGIAMSSCMNTDVVDETSDVQSGKIAFETHVNKATRAEVNGDLLADNLTDFFVAGSYHKSSESSSYLQIFNNVTIRKNGETWKQIDGQDRYWIKDATYKFFAYSDGNVKMENLSYTTGENPDWQINGYEVNDKHSKDLIFATADIKCEQETGNDPVPLIFKHLLSKIKFTFTTDVPDDNTVTIKNLRINRIHTKADYANGTWKSWAPSVDNFSIATKIEGITNKQKQETEEKFVMPYNYNKEGETKIQVAIALEIYNNQGSLVHSVNIMQTSIGSLWEPGYKYNYNVEIKASQAGLQKIEFTVKSVEKWEDGKLLDVNENLTFSTDIVE